MLIQPNSEQLGDKYLSPQEAAIREREELEKLTYQKYVTSEQALMEDADRSSGPRLYYTEILRRLSKINPSLLIKEGRAYNVAIYRPKRYDEYDYEQFDPTAPTDWRWDHEYVSGMEQGWIPEWGHLLLDNAHVATNEIRGWRSVLIALVKSRAVSYRDVIKEFGDPATDQRSGLWFSQLQKYLN